MFLAPLTARSKIREVLRGLVATRQVHTISLGHAPHFYVAGTLPEFAVPTTIYSSSSMPASAYFLHSHEHEEETPERHVLPTVHAAAPPPAPPINAPEEHAPRIPVEQKPTVAAKPSAPRPHFSRPATHSRDRKPAQSSSGSRTARRTGSETRTSSARPSARTSGTRTSNGARTASGARWAANGAKSTNGKREGAHTVSNGSNGTRANGNGNGNGRNHGPKVSSGVRSSKSSAAPISQRNGHGTKPVGKSGAKVVRGSSLVRGSAPRKDARPDARASRGSRKPALAAGAKAGNSKRYGFTAPAKKAAGRSTKKRG